MPVIAQLVVCLGIALCMLPQACLAGAWARETGKAFVSVSTFTSWPAGRAFELPDVYASAYAEYGLGHRLTLGLDLGTPDYERPERARGTAFLRYTLTAPGAQDQVALHVGGGIDELEPVVRLGASYGRGLTLLGHPSWLSIEAHGLHAIHPRTQHYQIDSTLGLSAGQMKYMLQVSASQSYSGQQRVTVTPSALRRFGKATHIEVGVAIGVTGKPDPALKIGIWQEF